MEAINSAEDFLAIVDLDSKVVDVPEWKRSVNLKVLSCLEHEQLGLFQLEQEEKGVKFNGLRKELLFLLACLVDAEGKRIFAYDQLDTLMGKQLSVLQRLAYEAMELNGFVQSAPDEETPDAVAEEIKNSESSPADTNG